VRDAVGESGKAQGSEQEVAADIHGSVSPG
jgi:hypothetical protein